MAGEWIKVECATPDKPELMRAARRLSADRDLVFGKLLRLWAWFDQNSVDGHVDGVVSTDVDAIVGMDGFASVIASVGWLDFDDEAEYVELPNFERHNGETAKKRALKNKRQTQWRRGRRQDVDASPSTDATTREEKRREEVPPYSPPKGTSESTSRFADFWEVYPRKRGRQPALKKWKQKRLDAKADDIIADVKKRLAWDRQWRDGYVPNPATYLHQERWTDEIEFAGAAAAAGDDARRPSRKEFPRD